jgi:polysaccharide biosynthesis transport protein
VTVAALSHEILRKLRIASAATSEPAPDPVRRTGLAADILSRNLKVAPIGRSTMVKIDVTSGDPKTAAQVASAIANNYIEARNQIRVDAAKQASSWLSDHTAELRTHLVEAETGLARFRATVLIGGRDPLQLEGDMKVLGDRIVAAKGEQAKAAMRLAVAEERVRREGPLSLLSWDAGPGPDEVLTQARAIADMRREAAKMAATVGAFNPNVARLEAEAKALEAKTTSEAQA